ncbi:hypothetical protein JCM17823_07370 [Halorubrum gandharaense]
MSSLDVELNGDGVHSISAPDRFSTDRPFSIVLTNLGRSTHVHLHLDDQLDAVASLAATNHYVEDESIRRVHVSTDAVSEPVVGKLKVVTGYGSGVEYVDVRIEPRPEEAPDTVVVDESLAKPPEPDPDPSLRERVASATETAFADGVAPALVFALVAVVVAVVVATLVDSVVVLAGVGLVVVAALAAAMWVLR